MPIYYLPLLIRSDRYFITRLEPAHLQAEKPEPDFNFVIPASDRVLTPLLTIEDPGKLVINQMAPSHLQDIPLRECHLRMRRNGDLIELIIRHSTEFQADAWADEETGIRMDYSSGLQRVTIGYYHHRVQTAGLRFRIILETGGDESFSGEFLFSISPAEATHRVVIDFGSEASQVAYRNGGPLQQIQSYDLLGNLISRLRLFDKEASALREDYLNHEPGQPMLYRSFYAVKKKITAEQRAGFPFNFSASPDEDEIRLFISRQEVSALNASFRDQYEIIPNLKLGIETSLQLHTGTETEDYSIRTHKKELISAILLRILKLMIHTKPAFREGGMIVTLLVPNIYSQHDVFELMNELRRRCPAMLQSAGLQSASLPVEFETISESDAAFMGYQQTHRDEARLSNGEMALVIDCGKGTTDISMLLADDNENYSSFFRTGFAGAGNMLHYAFAEDFLTHVLRVLPGDNRYSVSSFITDHIQSQHLTADVLQFAALMEDQKKRFEKLAVLSPHEFGLLHEDERQSERNMGGLHKDPSTVLSYACAILHNRNLRWDDEVTGLIHQAADCIVEAILSSIRDVLTKDIRKRVKVVMLSGRAFYFTELRVKLEKALRQMLGHAVGIKTVAPGRAVNNKNVAIHGAFSGAYKITDFTGMPIDQKEGLSRNNDVLNNNLYLYRGIKIEPGNDILYNASIVRRNNQELKAFKNKTVDIYFTRDNIYLRLMENQQVKDVRSLYSIMTSLAESYSAIRDMKAISMFPAFTGELPSVSTVYEDVMREKNRQENTPVPKKEGILAFFHL